MYKTFTLPLKSAIFSLSALFILTACGGFTIDLNLPANSDCIANPFESECDESDGIAEYRKLVISNCADNPNKSDTSLCIAAEESTSDTPSDDENGAEGAVEEVVVKQVVDNTPKDILIKSEFDKNSFTKTDKEKGGTTTLEIVDLCSDPANAKNERCSPAVIDCINNPFSGSCQGDNVLGNFVRDGVTVSKTVVLQDKRAEDCRTGRIDRALCQNLGAQKQRCTGAPFGDEICSAVTYSVCKADAFDPLCGEKENFGGVYFNERSEVCYEDPNNPNCTGANGHIDVVCREYPFDRLCTGNTNYDSARANACEANPSISSSCSAAPVVDVCLDNPFGPTCADSDYNKARKDLVKTCAIQAVTGAATTACNTIIEQVGPCFIDPFSTVCDGNHHAVKNYIGLLRSSRVALCESNLGGLESWIAPLCASVPDTTPVVALPVTPPAPATPQVTASVWANSFTTPLATEATRNHLYNTESQFLIGRETDLDSGDVPLTIIRTSGNLNLADATFNRVALGGDRADGLAFLTDGALYAGILSGTNLGAPLTDTAGTAKWIGSFQLAGYSPTDFILNVSFGTGSGAGEIEAVIQNYIYFFDHHIKGEFDDAGVITGTAQNGVYRRNDPANRGEHYSPGKLTGLIGEEGAVGAFIVDDYYSVGGFVARPSSAKELRTLEQTCADDPFNRLCTVGYQFERDARIEHCITGGNANDESCGSANELHVCIKHPFRVDCAPYLPDHYQQARANRVAFCRTEGNAGNALCTVTETFAHICTNHPFDAQCLGNNDYNEARENACDTAGAGSTECRTLAGLNCSNDPFHSYCGGGYSNVRETACRNGSTNRQCGGIISGICGNNPFDPLCGSGYTQIRRNACSGDPFATRCAGDVYNDLRVSFCENNAGTHPSCPAPEPTITEPTIAEVATPQVTASVWADSFALPLAHGATAADRRNKFLIGRATNLDTGGLTPYRRNSGLYTDNRNLNLADATFNGQSLGGDRADGVAFFATGLYTDNTYRVYAGILEGTNLGAPLTDTAGSAKWLGSFKVANYSPQDFILNISFGTGDGAGEIEGVIERYNRAWDYEIKGEFDDAGVIAGSVRSPGILGFFSAYPLTGLIGEEGAVGAFLLVGYHGGFVARPPSAEELQSVEQTCNDNPFDKLCSIGYESQRNAIIEQCIVGDNANNDALCGEAITWDVCVESPFFTNCNYRLPDYYEQAQANRLAFCRTAGNADNALCNIWATVKHICTTYPFDAQCLGDNRFTELRRDACLGDPFATRCAGEGYNDLRVSFCEGKVGNHPSCPAPEQTTIVGATPQVTAKVWADSFETPLARGATLDDTSGQFLIGRATDLDTGGVTPFSTDPDYDKGLTLADATFNGVALGGDAADGVAFFAAEYNNSGNGGWYSYAGIMEGTNLGAPLTDTAGSAKWVGSFRYEGYVAVDFILNVSFGTGDGAGEIEAIVERYRAYGGTHHYDYHIAGEFNDAGVITGTVGMGVFRTSDPANRGTAQFSGPLTGLIGEEGAIGAWNFGSHYGGFVARPSSQNELQNLTRTCAADPFNDLCTVGYESQREAVIERCIIGGNANDVSCGSAVVLNPCINNPFKSTCDERFPQHYEQARANRLAFCRTAGNANNALCTVSITFHHICTNHPFDAQCLSNNRFTPLRISACSDNPFATRCAGDAYNDLRVTFCENNAGNSACPEPEIQHPAGHVTGTVWADSFAEGELAAKASRTDTVSKFLKGRAGDLDAGGIRALANGNVNYSGILTFDDGLFFHGDAADGVAFFAAEKVNGRFLSYAGILSGTDLGAPVTQTEGVAEWPGSFQFEGYSATDFTLNVVFGGGDEAGLINAIIQNYTNNDFHVAGSFDDTGVITGNVYLGTFDTTSQDPIGYGITKYTAELTGLIGQQGAVGAFVGSTSSTTGFAGGFIAAPDGEGYTVRTADWLASFDTEPVSIPTDRNSQFLKASATGFDLDEMPGITRNTQQLAVLTLADNFATGASLGGHGADGVAFFGRRIDGYYRYYAGILANTDLGLPLEPENTPTYEWHGVFQAIGSDALKTDFTLKVTYTGGQYAGTVEAFINKRNDYYYHIKGNFNHSSFILSGTVDYGQYTDGNRNDPVENSRRRTGVLSGLIGQEGAIGAFIADSFSTSGYYSGGFVVASNFVDLAPPNEVTTADWLASFDTPLATRSPIRLQHNGYRNWDQFLRSTPSGPDAGGAEVLQLTYTGFDNSTFDGQSLDEAATGGLYSLHTYYNGLISNFASVHFDTDLGSPLSEIAGTKLIWYGTFQTSIRDFGPSRQGRDYNPQTQDFALEINFGAGSKVGTVEAFVKNIKGYSSTGPSDGVYHYAKGEFDANGVIDGTVKNGVFRDHDRNRLVNDGSVGHTRGILSGLIGQDGAVGVFQGGTGSGGFIAAPTVTSDSNVKYSDWVNSFDYEPASVSYVDRNHFLQNPPGLPSTGINSNSRIDTSSNSFTNISIYSLRLDDDIFQDGGGDATDGMVFYKAHNGDDADSYFYAGILNDTDLGAPLTQTSGTATWSGRFRAVLSGSILRAFSRDFTLDITFNATGGDISTVVSGRTEDYFELGGTFNKQGVISGTVNHVRYENGRIGNITTGDIVNSGPVTGLIGQEGAVGAFVSNLQSGNTGGFAGGFVARPPSE